jgi:hypothetical protein
MKRFTRVAVSVSVVLIASAGVASAEVGKKISVASNAVSVAAGSFPSFSTPLSVAIPTTYRSKTNFLKITTTYQTQCTGGDYMGSEVRVGGFNAELAGLPIESWDEDAASQVVTKTYFLVPESQSGPAIPPESLVEVRVTSNNGNCQTAFATLTVEATK